MIIAFWTSLLVVALAEMGDKTQLVALTLASRFQRPWTVMLGILIATVLNHTLASSVGVWAASLVPEAVLAWALGLSFVAFGIWTLVPDRVDETRSQDGWGPLLTTTVVFFLVEMGDKTQLATVALGARYHSTIAVTAGTTLGMLLADGLAVLAGSRLTRMVSIRMIRWLAAMLFFVFGATVIAGAIGMF